MTQEKINLDLLAYKLDQVIEKQDSTCDEIKELYANIDERISSLEKHIAWGKGLFAGIGIVTITTLIKLFFNIP